MLSILIPVYNFNVRELVSELYSQATDLHIPFEIRCYDDNSYFEYRMQNQRITAMTRVTYRELPENLGRSRIRNKLAEDARYNNLIFLDCDGITESRDFITRYKPFFDQQGVVCGGRTYAASEPNDKDLLLHWNYGKTREVTSAGQRTLNVYKGFQTNNFLIDKETFLNIQLDEELTGYGHEDTLFGIELERRKVKVTHIENPIRHIGLEPSGLFIEKTREGIKNLAHLIRVDKASTGIKLFKAFRMVTLLGLGRPVKWWLSKKEGELFRKATSQFPDLNSFDQLKLLWLLREMSA